jgi:hypothetical protein
MQLFGVHDGTVGSTVASPSAPDVVAVCGPD